MSVRFNASSLLCHWGVRRSMFSFPPLLRSNLHLCVQDAKPLAALLHPDTGAIVSAGKILPFGRALQIGFVNDNRHFLARMAHMHVTEAHAAEFDVVHVRDLFLRILHAYVINASIGWRAQRLEGIGLSVLVSVPDF